MMDCIAAEKTEGLLEYLIGSLGFTQFGFKLLYPRIFLVDRFTFVTTAYKI